MPTELDHILIFKTTIRTPFDRHYLKSSLDTHDQIQQWSVDLEDCDHVLRIESDSLTHGDIIHLIKQLGFDCIELD